MAAIFIGYRQSDAKAWAVAVRDALAAAFGPDAVFIDKDGLDAGPWSVQLETTIRNCRVMLVVIGRDWLDARGPSGSRRLDDPADVHRREIELGLSLPGVTVVPLLVDDARMPEPAALPPALGRLAAMQAFDWSDRERRRRADLQLLVEAIETRTGLRARRHRRAGVSPPLLAALVLTAVVAVAFSMASMGLSSTELVVVLIAALGLCYGARACWQRVRGSAAGG